MKLAIAGSVSFIAALVAFVVQLFIPMVFLPYLFWVLIAVGLILMLVQSIILVTKVGKMMNGHLGQLMDIAVPSTTKA